MQFFIVKDGTVFLETMILSFFKAFNTLVGVYYTFNIAYKGTQKLFQFFEELGFTPAKKMKKYWDYVACLLSA